MFNLSNAPTVPLGDDELSADADEPPDDQISPLTATATREALYHRSNAPPNPRRESLLTRAIMAESKHGDDTHRLADRGLSTTSSHSTASMPSTAELTSDGDTSQSRSVTPSPPPPSGRFAPLLDLKKNGPQVVIAAPITKDEREAAVEKTLGRKRCIMFACGGTDSEKSNDNVTLRKQKPAVEQPEAPKRKCALTFACPSRTSAIETKGSPAKLRAESKITRRPSPAPFPRKSTSESVDVSGHSAGTARMASPEKTRPNPPSPKATFHEFAASQDETDAWVDKPDVHKERITFDDCMKKENRIRQIGREAEEEAEEEEREQEELGNASEDEYNDNEDDFAPSDDGSDDGNESDDEGGFASSDEESDGGSEYRFWAPSNTVVPTGSEHINISHFSARRQSEASSVESLTRSSTPPLHSMMKQAGRRRNIGVKVSKMRPGTPELPDSTDFVCGTLDEDRPLEAAYISCREQKKREKHIPIPQDIDPSFPTTDPEDNEENSDEEELADSQHSSDGPRWLKDGFADFDEEHQGRRKPSFTMPIAHSPSPPRAAFGGRVGRTTHRSPPPRHAVARSPPPRKLFGHSPTRLRSPFPSAKLRSPRGSPTYSAIPTRINPRGLAQRPTMERTASLPDTPNPFFKNFHIGSPSISNIASGAVTPAIEEPPRPDMHVRGPVDIVAGLEKKRQKRKEKYWRQHCRKAAKEQAERKPIPGRGAERMKELGLECAERTKGYGIGQQTQLVLSL
ncbi:hypothetical protein AYL99_02694 [Fonsecaea erecta]|uniref:Uncharacterized protein n=1 Tax=Fonsecaea erecta TaxID=1367422 RepID=A0A178ZUP0_9EURO|nr:hypothetical protein AYL99_02694 [Fonsecaea erecta]OAP63467.1 hypothetical protein AYL99_02694 [Fonsecaea erecta]